VLQRGERAKIEHALRDELQEAQARVAELETEAATQRRMGYQVAIDVMRQEKLPMSVELLEAQLELEALDTPQPHERPAGAYPPASLAPQGQQARTILDRARDALNARMTKDDLRHVLSNVIAYAAELERRIEAEECRCPEPAPLCEGCQCRCHTDEQRSAEPADGITRRIAPVQALREDSQNGSAR
jgi:hypothetical protein